eukprot:Nk52_evm44s62 gene=Nk52_evmTU44s62
MEGFKEEKLGKIVRVPALQQQLRGRVCSLISFSAATDRFPGCQPVSFAKGHIYNIENEDYWMCEKSDGIRYLVYSVIAQQRAVTYLVNRKFEFLEVPVSFVTKKGTYHKESLLDGELVLDRVTNREELSQEFIASKCIEIDSQLYTKNFLLFDAINVNGKNIRSHPLNERLQFLHTEIIKPRETLKEKNPKAIQSEPFGMCIKQMFKTYHLRHMFEVIIPSLKHDNDGLIFTPVNMCYIPGQWKKLLKWKPGNLNTIDFMLESFWGKWNMALGDLLPQNGMSADQKVLHFRLLAGSGGVHGFYDWLTLDRDQYEKFCNMKKINGRIVECVFDEEAYTVNPETGAKFKGGWKVLRFRDDKTTANDINTIKKILNSVNDNVTEQDLLEHQDTIHHNWKDREKGILPPPKETNKNGRFKGKGRGAPLNLKIPSPHKRKSDFMESPQQDKRLSFGASCAGTFGTGGPND